MSTLRMDPRLRARRIEVMRVRGRRRLWVLIALLWAILTTMGGWWVVMKSPLLDVDSVNVTGAEHTSVAAIMEASGVTNGQPLVEVDGLTARSAIADLPWVQSVTSDRSLGGDVDFVVVERQPVAAIRGAQSWLLVDRDGRVLDTAEEVPVGLLTVGGSRWQIAPGGWIGESALSALDVAALLPAGLQPKVASVQTVSDGLELVLFGGGRVILGDSSELDQKFLSALTLLVRLDISCLDRIDVRAPSVPVLTRVDDCS